MKRVVPAAIALLLFLFHELAAAQQKEDAGLWDKILRAERAELDALKAGDVTAFANMIAEEATFVDAAGSATKSEVVKHVAGFRLHDYAMSDIRFVSLSRNSGIITYRCAETGASHGRDFSTTVWVSAVWVKRGGKWLSVFSQETATK